MTKKLLQSGILVLLILSISGCHKKNPDTIESLSEASVSASDETDAADSSDSSADVSSEEETLETTETETELVPETTRVSSENLPDTAIYNDTVLDNYTLTIDAAQRFTINYPKDFSVDKEDAYKTYLTKDNTQIFIYCVNQAFDNCDEVYYSDQIQDALYRMPYTIDGENYTLSVIDRDPVTHITIGDKTVARETATAEFSSHDLSKLSKPLCISYFTAYDDRGFALIAYSTDKSSEELDKILTDMMSTLGTYTPSRNEAAFEFASDIFSPNDGTGIKLPYPSDWSISTTAGFSVISAPENDTIYTGAKIIYRSDKDHSLVTDYAQYAGITDEIAKIYMKTGYEPDKMNNEFTVLSMDSNVSLNGAPCYLFQIKDSLHPLNKTNELLLPSCGEDIYSYRYTFNSNGIPVMVSFQYTEGNEYQVRDMADLIMEQIVTK